MHPAPRKFAPSWDQWVLWIFLTTLAASLWCRLSDTVTFDEPLWHGRFYGYTAGMGKKVLSLLNLLPGEVKFQGQDAGMSNRLFVGLPGTLWCMFTSREGFDRHIIYRGLQVAEWTLGLGFFLLLSARRLKIPWTYSALLLLSMPIIRGMARVINYDTFVSTFILLSLLSYHLFRSPEGGRRDRILSIAFSVLALITKPSGIFVLTYLLMLEIHRCGREAGSYPAYLRLLIREMGSFAWIAAFSFLLFMPNIWLAPSSTQPYFHDLSELILSQPAWLLALIITGFAVLALGAWNLLRLLEKVPLPSALSRRILLTVFFLVFGIAALFFQKDGIAHFDSFDVDALVKRLREDGYFYSMTTDHAFTYFQSHTASIFLNGFNAAKILLFTTPVPILLLFAWGAIVGSDSWKIHWLGFIGFYVAVFACMMVMPTHRYLLPCHYAMVMVAAGGLAALAERWPFRRAWLHLLLVAGLIPQLLAAFPTDLAYSNILRDKKVDDSLALAARGSEGLWSGWGEHFLPVVDYLNRLPAPESLTVLFDYKYVRNFRGKIQYGDAFACGDCPVDYFVFSKVMWFRDEREMEWLRSHVPEKVFAINGVRYAMLFKAPLPAPRVRMGFPIPQNISR